MRSASTVTDGRLPLGLAAVLLVSSPGCYQAREIPAPTEAACQGCHGSPSSPAPPPGLWLSGSRTETTDRGVGAHAAHLAGGPLSLAVPCGTCHHVPASVDEPGHLDSPLPAEVIFSGLAVARETQASWDGTSCSVYCHAGKLPGGSLTRPKWTQVDGTQDACGTCHGLPPGGDHPRATTCSGCHDQTVDAGGKIKDRSLHLNGQVEVKGGSACNSCHGSPDNAAPPLDTSGNSSETARGVGAHQAHVRASPRHAALDCGECHIKPSSVDAPGHMDTPLPAEVTFGALARTGGKQPTWDTTSLSCKTTYCHGLDGGGEPEPRWNIGEHLVCGSCHGLPPSQTSSGSAHPTASLAECTNCHKSVIDGAGQIIDAGRHVNGKVDFQ